MKSGRQSSVVSRRLAYFLFLLGVLCVLCGSSFAQTGTVVFGKQSLKPYAGDQTCRYPGQAWYNTVTDKGRVCNNAGTAADLGSGGGGTVTNTGALTAGKCMAGNGGSDSKVDPNCSLDGSGNQTLVKVTAPSGFYTSPQTSDGTPLAWYAMKQVAGTDNTWTIATPADYADPTLAIADQEALDATHVYPVALESYITADSADGVVRGQYAVLKSSGGAGNNGKLTSLAVCPVGWTTLGFWTETNAVAGLRHMHYLGPKKCAPNAFPGGQMWMPTQKVWNYVGGNGSTTTLIHSGGPDDIVSAGTAAATAGSGTLHGYEQYTSATTANAQAGWIGSGSDIQQYKKFGHNAYMAVQGYPADTTGTGNYYWVGLAKTFGATQTNTDYPNTSFAVLRYKVGTDTNWMCETGNTSANGSQLTSGVAVDATAPHIFEIWEDTTQGVFRFAIDGTEVCVGTAWSWEVNKPTLTNGVVPGFISNIAATGVASVVRLNWLFTQSDAW